MQNIIGLKGGSDGTFFEIIAETGRRDTEYFPSIKDGVELKWNDPEYWQHKVTRQRHTVIFTVAGNAVCAEYALKKKGYAALAVAPSTVYVFPKDDSYVQCPEN